MSYGGFTLPKGFKFQPSDDLLLSYYLQKKNQGKDSQITAIMPVIDLCRHEPRDLPALVFTRAQFLDKEWFTMADSPDMEWYFFGPIDFKYSNCKSKSKSPKINRSTKEGSWKKQGDDRRITEAYSDKQIGGKRILTFYLHGRQKTDWVIHEYYLTKADSDEQIGDFFLYRLKDNSSKKKAGKSAHDRQDAPLCDGGRNQASIEVGNVVVSPNGNDDAAEDDGSSCSMALNVENPASKPLVEDLPMLLGDHDDTEHGGGSCHFDSGMLTEAEEYSLFKMLQDVLESDDNDQEELRGSQIGPCSIDKELLHEPGDLASLHQSPSPVLQSPIYTNTRTNSFLDDENRKRKYPFGDSDPFLRKKNHTDEVDNNTSSNSECQAADPIPEGYSLPSINRELGDLCLSSDQLVNMTLTKKMQGDFVLCRLKNKSEKDLSVSIEGEPGRGDDEMNQEGNGELHQPQPLDECCSSALCSPASQELEAVLQTNGTGGDCNELNSPVGDSESCPLDMTEVSTYDENETLYDVYPQLRDPPEENLETLLHAIQPQDDCPPILQSPIYTTLGNVAHPLQPQDYQPLVILQSPIYVKQGNVPTDRVDIPVRHVMSNVENQAPDCWSQEVPHPRTEINEGLAVYPFQLQDSTKYGDSGVSNDTDIEVAHGWVQYLSASAMGTTLHCS